MKRMSGKVSKFSEGELVWLYRDTRSKTYFGELFLRYLPLVYGICLKNYQGREEAKRQAMVMYDNMAADLLAEPVDINNLGRWMYKKIREYCTAPDNYSHIARIHEYDDPGYSRCVDLLCSGIEDPEECIDRYCYDLLYSHKVCMKKFFAEKKTFAEISESTGYLINGIKDNIRTGIKHMARHFS